VHAVLARDLERLQFRRREAFGDARAWQDQNRQGGEENKQATAHDKASIDARR
jgi:hypothetical protein